MEAYWIVVGIIALIAIAIGIMKYLNSCTHSWRVYHEYEVISSKTQKPIGFMRISECEYCKKIRKEQVDLHP